MIEFACSSCGRAFAVPDTFAGRKARCKSCGTELVVPSPKLTTPATTEERTVEEPSRRNASTGGVGTSNAPPVSVDSASAPSSAVASSQSPPPPMRIRRLLADAQQMATAFEKSETIRVTPVAGDPPDTYRIEYRIASLERDPKGKPKPRDQHLVEIQLTSDYPRLSPKCKMLTPIFHPNIDPATICVGDHWTAGERLADLVVRIGEMLAYQAYNIKSPLDGEAAMWADLNQEKLPTDARNFRPAGME